MSLARQYAALRAAIVAVSAMLDADALTAAWDAALRAPLWQGPPVWVHGDLLPGNLVVAHGRLSAVIALPYHAHTNPVLAAVARHTIDQVLADQATA